MPKWPFSIVFDKKWSAGSVTVLKTGRAISEKEEKSRNFSVKLDRARLCFVDM